MRHITLEIPLNNGNTESVGVVPVGEYLCVHPTTKGCTGFRITHVPTKKAMPAIFCGECHALVAAGRLGELKWNLRGGGVPASTRRAAWAILSEQLKDCGGCRNLSERYETPPATH